MRRHCTRSEGGSEVVMAGNQNGRQRQQEDEAWAGLPRLVFVWPWTRGA